MPVFDGCLWLLPFEGATAGRDGGGEEDVEADLPDPFLGVEDEAPDDDGVEVLLSDIPRLRGLLLDGSLLPVDGTIISPLLRVPEPVAALVDPRDVVVLLEREPVPEDFGSAIPRTRGDIDDPEGPVGSLFLT